MAKHRRFLPPEPHDGMGRVPSQHRYQDSAFLRWHGDQWRLYHANNKWIGSIEQDGILLLAYYRDGRETRHFTMAAAVAELMREFETTRQPTPDQHKHRRKRVA